MVAVNMKIVLYVLKALTLLLRVCGQVRERQ